MPAPCVRAADAGPVHVDLRSLSGRSYRRRAAIGVELVEKGRSKQLCEILNPIEKGESLPRDFGEEHCARRLQSFLCIPICEAAVPAS